MILEDFVRNYFYRRNLGEKRANSGEIRIFRGIRRKIWEFFVRKWRKILEFRGKIRFCTEITSFLGGNADLQKIFEDFRRKFRDFCQEMEEKIGFRGKIRFCTEITSFLGGNADLQKIFEDFRRNFGDFCQEMEENIGISRENTGKCGNLRKNYGKITENLRKKERK